MGHGWMPGAGDFPEGEQGGRLELRRETLGQKMAAGAQGEECGVRRS